MAEHTQTLARRVESLRKAKGWSRLRLANEADLSEKTIARIENAQPIETRSDTFDKLANALGVPVHDLDAGRPTLEELEREEGPLERIERKLDALAKALEDGASQALAGDPIQGLASLVQQLRAATPPESPAEPDAPTGTDQ